MKKLLFVFIFFISIGILVNSPIASAQENASSSSSATRVVRVPASEIIDKDFYLAAGEIVEISGTVNGDVYAAGGQVIIDGVVEGDLMASGGTITISGEVKQDVRVAGGQVIINGIVGRNLTVFGGNVEINPNAQIVGSILGGGGNVSLSAPVGGDVQLGAGNLTVSSLIDGTLTAYVGQLRLTSKANVTGNLVYTSDSLGLIDDAATIGGSLTYKATPESVKTIDTVRTSSSRDFGKVFAGMRAGFSIVGFFAALVVGLILLSLFPVYMQSVSDQIEKRFWASIGIGFVGLFLTPLAVLLLFVSIVGFPIGFMLLLLFPIYLYLAKIFVSYWVGILLCRKFAWKLKERSTFALGLVVYSLLRFVPFFGEILAFIVLLVGLGSALLADYNFFQVARDKKLL